MKRFAPTLLAAFVALAPSTVLAQDEEPSLQELQTQVADRLELIERQLRQEEVEIARQVEVLTQLMSAVKHLHDDPPMTGRDAARARLDEAKVRAEREPALEGAVPRALAACESVLDGAFMNDSGAETAREMLAAILPLERATLDRAAYVAHLSEQLRRLSDRVGDLSGEYQGKASHALQRLYGLHQWALEAR